MIRQVDAADMAEWKALRERSVREHPDAFYTSDAEERAMTIDDTLKRNADNAANGGCILGAWVDGVLVGTAGLYRENREKGRHKAYLWGMYVAPDARGTGLGRALVEGILERARAIDGVSLVQLSVVTTQTVPLELYKSVGFVQWGLERDAMRVDGQRMDEAHMQIDF